MADGDAAAIGTWDSHAARYGLQERFEARAVAEALRLAAPGPADRLVDLATGTGIVLRALAAQQERPATAVGVDRSPGMLSRVGSLPEGWRAIEGDARAVPLPDGAADAVTCCYLLHLLDPDDRSRVLGETLRLLGSTPGSRLVTVTVWASRATVGGRAAGSLLRGLATLAPVRLGGLMPLDPTPDLERAGFVVTHRVTLPRGLYPSLVLRAEPA